MPITVTLFVGGQLFAMLIFGVVGLVGVWFLQRVVSGGSMTR